MAVHNVGLAKELLSLGPNEVLLGNISNTTELSRVVTKDLFDRTHLANPESKRVTIAWVFVWCAVFASFFKLMVRRGIFANNR
jgi:hypothetical protein